MNCEKILDILSIIIQIAGSIILYIYSPINKPDGAFISASNPSYDKPKKRNKRSRNGFLLLFIGITIQLIIKVFISK